MAGRIAQQDRHRYRYRSVPPSPRGAGGRLAGAAEGELEPPLRAAVLAGARGHELVDLVAVVEVHHPEEREEDPGAEAGEADLEAGPVAAGTRQ